MRTNKRCRSRPWHLKVPPAVLYLDRWWQRPTHARTRRIYILVSRRYYPRPLIPNFLLSSLTSSSPATKSCTRNTPMPHPIIEISEVAQLIFDHLAAPGSRIALVSFACTCKGLEEHALRTLWSRQNSVRVLVKSTLPRSMLSSPLRSQVRDIVVVWYLAGF